MVDITVPSECITLKHTTIFKKFKNIIFRIIDLGTYFYLTNYLPTLPHPTFTYINYYFQKTIVLTVCFGGYTVWSNSRRPSARSDKFNACANSVDMPFHKVTRDKRGCFRHMILHNREDDMVRC